MWKNNLFLILFLVSHCYTQTNTGIAKTATVLSLTEDDTYYTITETLIDTSIRTTEAIDSDIGSCTCNIQYNTCDPYCCCDSDCPASTLKIWTNLANSQCTTTCKIENYLIYLKVNSERYCFQNDLIHKINSRRGMKIHDEEYLTKQHQICIEIDASQDLLTNYQKEYTEINSEFSVDDAITAAKRKDYYQQLVRTSTSSSTASANYGAPFTIAGLNFFAPRPGLGNECQDWNKVNYLESMPKTSCFRTANLKTQTDCQSGFLNANYFLGKYTLTQIQKITSSTVQVLSVAPSSSWGSCQCSNFLRGMTVYVISETQIAVDIYTDTVKSTDTDCTAVGIEQWFEIKHVDTFYFEPSGRPGYQFGKPVLGGTYATGVAVVADKNWLFVRGKNTDGSCMEALSTSEYNYFTDDVINFGENMKIFCSKTFESTAQLETFCASTTLDTFQLFKNFDVTTGFGKFGNAKISGVNDWITLTKSSIFDTIQKEVANSNLKCTFPMHQILLIFYKSVGYERARQYQITHAYLTYDTTEFIQFQQSVSLGMGLTMTSIQNTMKFINLDIDELVIKEKRHTNLLPAIPNDILFPFLYKDSPLQNFNNFMLIVFLFLIYQFI